MNTIEYIEINKYLVEFTVHNDNDKLNVSLTFNEEFNENLLEDLFNNIKDKFSDYKNITLSITNKKILSYLNNNSQLTNCTYITNKFDFKNLNIQNQKKICSTINNQKINYTSSNNCIILSEHENNFIFDIKIIQDFIKNNHNFDILLKLKTNTYDKELIKIGLYLFSAEIIIK